MDSCILENTGSTARDFCMLERNILSHVKLALVFSLLSSSVLLRTRLVPSKDIPNEPESGLSLAILHVVASLAAIAAGLWEYYNGFRDMRNTRAFLLATKSHLAIMSVVSGVVFITCLILLAEADHS